MAALINPVLDAAEFAANVSGVPYLSSAVVLVRSIKDNCDRIQVRKSDCRLLADKAAQLTDTLQEQAHRLQESQLREYTDQIEVTLAKVAKRTGRWANYGSFHAFWRDSKIGDGIKECTSELDTALAKFQVNAIVVNSSNQEEIMALIYNNQENVEQILQILRNREQILQVAALEQAGNPVAERVMDAGKRQLQALRQRQGDSPDVLRTPAYIEMERGMSQLYAITKVPPTVRNLNGEITRPDELPYSGGTYSDVWVGYWLGDQKVALKTMRGVTIPPEKAQKRFESEINVWSKLSHPHILSFLGIVTDLGHFTHMVSPWQNNGNILDYCKKFHRADRLHLLTGAAEGLAYLHSKRVIHGNVRCSNILVAVGGESVLCDFGMAKIREETSAQSATFTLTTQGSARWMAPELLDATLSSPTASCDVYSFAMTMLECFTLQQPFAEIKRDIHVITKMSKSPLIPKRPESSSSEDAARWITDGVWAVMTECWNTNVQARPSMQAVAERMRELEMKARRSMSEVSLTSSASSSGTSTPTSIPTATHSASTSPAMPSPFFFNNPAAFSSSPA